jgi:hypothetical protein
MVHTIQKYINFEFKSMEILWPLKDVINIILHIRYVGCYKGSVSHFLAGPALLHF